eukprot:g16845.t1
MGVDKHDLRRIIIASTAPELDDLAQKAGRAGRDGSQASCHIFYDGHTKSEISKFVEPKSIEPIKKLFQNCADKKSCVRKAAWPLVDLFRPRWAMLSLLSWPLCLLCFTVVRGQRDGGTGRIQVGEELNLNLDSNDPTSPFQIVTRLYLDAGTRLEITDGEGVQFWNTEGPQVNNSIWSPRIPGRALRLQVMGNTNGYTSFKVPRYIRGFEQTNMQEAVCGASLNKNAICYKNHADLKLAAMYQESRKIARLFVT